MFLRLEFRGSLFMAIFRSVVNIPHVLIEGIFVLRIIVARRHYYRDSHYCDLRLLGTRTTRSLPPMITSKFPPLWPRMEKSTLWRSNTRWFPEMKALIRSSWKTGWVKQRRKQRCHLFVSLFKYRYGTWLLWQGTNFKGFHCLPAGPFHSRLSRSFRVPLWFD